MIFLFQRWDMLVSWRVLKLVLTTLGIFTTLQQKRLLLWKSSSRKVSILEAIWVSNNPINIKSRDLELLGWSVAINIPQLQHTPFITVASPTVTYWLILTSNGISRYAKPWPSPTPTTDQRPLRSVLVDVDVEVWRRAGQPLVGSYGCGESFSTNSLVLGVVETDSVGPAIGVCKFWRWQIAINVCSCQSCCNSISSVFPFSRSPGCLDTRTG